MLSLCPQFFQLISCPTNSLCCRWLGDFLADLIQIYTVHNNWPQKVSLFCYFFVLVFLLRRYKFLFDFNTNSFFRSLHLWWECHHHHHPHHLGLLDAPHVVDLDIWLPQQGEEREADTLERCVKNQELGLGQLGPNVRFWGWTGAQLSTFTWQKVGPNWDGTMYSSDQHDWNLQILDGLVDVADPTVLPLHPQVHRQCDRRLFITHLDKFFEGSLWFEIKLIDTMTTKL